jgi:transposase
LTSYNSHSTIDLFIDTASINNKYGSELAAYGQNKKKKVTKVSLICNEKKFPLSVTFHKGSVHDVKTIDESVVTLIKNINYRRVNLTGDKGYIATKKTKDELFKKGIKLITPYRKNQKKTNCNKNKQLRKLKKRYVVEHANQKMKDYNRTYVRRDRLLITFKRNFCASYIWHWVKSILHKGTFVM